jgi:hypothetical protein
MIPAVGYMKPSVLSEPPPDLMNGLIEIHEFEDTSVSGYSYTSSAMFQHDAGKMGYSAYFNGSSYFCYRSYGTSTYPPVSGHSVTAWIKRLGHASSAYGGIKNMLYPMTGYRLFQFVLYNSNHATYPNLIGATYWDTSNVYTSANYSPASDIWTNNWVHVAYTRNGSNLSIYINGQLVLSVSGGNGSSQTKSNNLIRKTIGAHYYNPTNYTGYGILNAYITQMTSHSRALTGTEVSMLYNNGNGLLYINW